MFLNKFVVKKKLLSYNMFNNNFVSVIF